MADICQQQKRQPMIVVLNKMGDLGADDPADDRIRNWNSPK